MVRAARPLSRYHAKRDFSVTTEPRGDAPRPGEEDAASLAFVIQKHAASHLHFDLRLELDGVMKSWAVPKGPSVDPSVRRLAMQVEDHPVEYNSFEGVIPPGEYGGGTVMLWDRGTYVPDDRADDESVAAAVRRGLRAGKLAFTLHGERLHGAFALVRTRRGSADGKNGSGERSQWLLVKQRDRQAREGRDIVAEVDTSVESGRTMREIASARSNVWRGRTGDPLQEAGEVAGLERDTPIPRSTGSARVVVRAPAGAHAHDVSLSNLEKLFWKALHITKGDLLQYYTSISPYLLPHLADRAMVMKRYPHGADGEHFFMKRAPASRPQWIATCAITHASKSVIDFPMIQDLASLLWVVNLGCIDLNPWYARCDDVDRPDFLHFDLDPVPGATFAQVRETALLLHELLDDLQLPSYAKTSGSKGLHVYVPIERGPVQKDVWTVAKAIAGEMASRHPSLITAEYRVAKRPRGRVLVDYNQNAWGRTLASIYSVRPRAEATVSMPVTWDEVARGVEIEEFTLFTAPARLEARGDLWAPVISPDGRTSLDRLL